MHPQQLAFTPVLAMKCMKLNHFLRGAQQARQRQHQTLLDKIRRNADSAFGREFGFSEIRSVKDFQKRIPISDYELFRPYIDRVLRGELSAMFGPNERVVMFAMTSGTTNKPKHIPVTETFYSEYRRSWQQWGTAVYRDYPMLFAQSALQFSSDWDVSRSEGGLACGNISGLAAETRPWYIKPLFVLPAATMKIRDHAAKHYTALRISLAQPNVGMIVTANPSTLVEVAKRADRQRESLIRDIHDGSLCQDENVTPEVRDLLAPFLKPNRKRARRLEQIVEEHGRLALPEVWQQLRVLAVWTGGAVGIYLSQLPEYYGDVPLRDHGISASEGRMTIPMADGVQGGMLDYASHFYEFIPEDEYGLESPTVLEASDLEAGKNYYILLTTSSGLCRYDICDVVRCDGFQGQSPVLSFLNKGKNFSSFTGEKLSEHQVIQAVTRSFRELDLPDCTFTLAPSVEERPRYLLLLSSERHLQLGDTLAASVQESLSKTNVEYGDKCESGRILPIKLEAVSDKAWLAMRNARSRERGNFEEFKHPCLTSDLEFLSKLKQSIEQESKS